MVTVVVYGQSLGTKNKAIDIGESSICGAGRLKKTQQVVLYSKTSLNQRIIGPTLNEPFREVVGLRIWNIIAVVFHMNRFEPKLNYQYKEWSDC